MATVLLEIGTEELPAGYVPAALAQLAELARTGCAAARIAVADVTTWGTARRLVLYLTGVAERQAPAVREVRGPAAAIAFANGVPTQAALGFARSHGLAVTELQLKDEGGQEFVIAAFRDEGRPTAELLPNLFTRLITALVFPRTMRWGQGSVTFARPIRWITALLDDQAISFALDGVTADRLTRGHRFLAPGEVAVPHADAYHRVMDENHVLVEPEARRSEIVRQLEAIAQQEDAEIVDDGVLLEEIVYQVEFPTAVRCRIDDGFLSLPAEVLNHVLRREQQFFPLKGRAGTPLPGFIAVRNGDKAYLGGVRAGYESVARAKLLDAHFFFEQDLRRSLGERVEDLRGIVFGERLGTMHDKAQRLQRLAGRIAERLGLSVHQQERAARAGLLCKADLATALGNEHPEMRGTLGEDYARRAGEPEEVAVAIGEHLGPRNGIDPLPASDLGRVTALADKLDTVVGCFAAGLAPVGVCDPFELQSGALGIVRILAACRLRLPLPALIEDAMAQLPAGLTLTDEIQELLRDFFRAALTQALTTDGHGEDVIAAVLPSSDMSPADALLRARVITQRLGDPAFAGVVRTAARLAHQVRHEDQPIPEPIPEPLDEPAERELFTRYTELAPRAEFFASRGEFGELPGLLAALTPAVDALLNLRTGDPDRVAARLALARRVLALYDLLGDLAQIGTR